MSGWLIDTDLLKYLSPGAGAGKPSFRDWVSRSTEPLYLSTVSFIAIGAQIEKRRALRQPRSAAEMDEWLGGLVAHYSTRIHPVDAKVATRAGVLMRQTRDYRGRANLPNLLIAATAEVHGHGLLTENGSSFRSWAGIKLWDPFDGRLPRKGGP